MVSLIRSKIGLHFGDGNARQASAVAMARSRLICVLTPSIRCWITVSRSLQAVKAACQPLVTGRLFCQASKASIYRFPQKSHRAVPSLRYLQMIFVANPVAHGQSHSSVQTAKYPCLDGAFSQLMMISVEAVEYLLYGRSWDLRLLMEIEWWLSFSSQVIFDFEKHQAQKCWIIIIIFLENLELIDPSINELKLLPDLDIPFK